MSSASSRIGELLLERRLINFPDRDKALEIQQQIGGRLGSILIRIGALSEDALLPVLAEQLQMPLLGEGDLPVDPGAVHAWLGGFDADPGWWLDQEALAWEEPDGSVRIVARDPLKNGLIEFAERIFSQHRIEWCLLRGHELESLLEKFAGVQTPGQSATDDLSHLRELAEEAPVIEFVNNLIAQAIDQNASDIHVEPQKSNFHVRFRIDGILYNRFTLPRERFNAIASRIKLISGIDIAERRLPQDGRIRSRQSGKEFDIRVSSVPGIHGESIVLRLLPLEQGHKQIDSIGLETDHARALHELIFEPHGIILVTGPTGSGKSTSIYAMLEQINDGKKKIITVEDPVEYQMSGITQIQVQEEIDYTFARALRSILRQDPDVVMIGEIRDLETAEIAVQASLTGHLVLTTLHTNDAASAFTRLIDMGIEPFLIATPVRAVIAQRLVRRLCQHCAVSHGPLPEIIARVETILPEHLRHAKPQWRQSGNVSCVHCQGTGYRGRIGIYEIIKVDSEVQKMILDGTSVDSMWASLQKNGCRSLRQDGLLKARQGLTSIEEVLRVTAE